MNQSALKERMIRALSLELEYTERVKLPGGKLASVLICLGWSTEATEPSILVVKRADTGGAHSGQMAFPGGMSEPEESASELGVVTTALRETEEEVGIPPQTVEVLGQLPRLTTVTGFDVTPVVGILTLPFEKLILKVDPAEIQEAIWIPWSVLTSTETYQKEWVSFATVRYPIHVYQVGPHRIWGATGSMIKNLLDRWDSLR